MMTTTCDGCGAEPVPTTEVEDFEPPQWLCPECVLDFEDWMASDVPSGVAQLVVLFAE